MTVTQTSEAHGTGVAFVGAGGYRIRAGLLLSRAAEIGVRPAVGGSSMPRAIAAHTGLHPNTIRAINRGDSVSGQTVGRILHFFAYPDETLADWVEPVELDDDGR